jgi:hypothetical protein
VRWTNAKKAAIDCAAFPEGRAGNSPVQRDSLAASQRKRPRTREVSGRLRGLCDLNFQGHGGWLRVPSREIASPSLR